jgi:hypothetical protein
VGADPHAAHFALGRFDLGMDAGSDEQRRGGCNQELFFHVLVFVLMVEVVHALACAGRPPRLSQRNVFIAILS